MHRLLTRAEVEALLAPYGGRYVDDFSFGAERWTTSAGLELCLTVEYNGLYHEFMIQQAIELSIIPSLNT